MKQTKVMAAAALLTCLVGASAAKASMVYDWVPSGVGTGPSSGTLTISGGTVTSISFTAGSSLGTDVVDAFTGTYSILADGDLVLNGTSPVISGPFAGAIPLTWLPNPGGSVNPNSEQLVYDGIYVSGDWQAAPSTPVPESSTLISGALLILPMGASGLRILRKKFFVSNV